MDVIPLFSDEDKAFVAEKKEKGREESGIKTIARRFEGKKVEVSSWRITSTRPSGVPGCVGVLGRVA